MPRTLALTLLLATLVGAWASGAWAQAATPSPTLVSALESRRYINMDTINTTFLLAVVSGAGGAPSPEVTLMYRAQMGFIAAHLTKDPTIPVPNYAACLRPFNGEEKSVTSICKITMDKIMQRLAVARSTNPEFVDFLRVFTLSQRTILGIGRYLNQQFTPDELNTIASYHAFRLTQEKSPQWLKTYRTCIESNSQTITCKNLRLENLSAMLTLDYLKAMNGVTP